jgi:hypothetical protein
LAAADAVDASRRTEESSMAGRRTTKDQGAVGSGVTRE